VCRAVNDAGLHKLDVESDGQIIAYQNAAGLERYPVPDLDALPR
jgi:hypothetical protein